MLHSNSPQALAVTTSTTAATAALERYVPPAMLQHWRNAGCPEDMPPLLVPVPPWIAMKQPLMQHATRAKAAAAANEDAALEAAEHGTGDCATVGVQREASHTKPAPLDACGSASPPNTQPCSNDPGGNDPGEHDPGENDPGENDTDASGSPPPPSTPPKGSKEEASVLVMACGYAWCALGGHFPLAGTYFQHNEVFLDTSSVLYHIRVCLVGLCVRCSKFALCLL